MKILFLIDSLTAGGMERRMVELMKGLKRYRDIEMNLIVFSDNIHYRQVYDLGIPINIIKRKPKKNPFVFYRVFRLCKNWDPDLMHSWGTMSAIWAIPTAKFLKIKLVNGNIVDAPNSMGFFDRRLFRARITFPFSAVVVGNSGAGLKSYGVPKGKGRCIYNGFDIQRISMLKEKDVVREAFDIKTSKVIGMVGSFSERKDFKTFILAALDVIKERKDTTFILAGDGPKLKLCRELVPSKYGYYFKFTGVQTDIESLINVFDIGVMATNTLVHGEGISNAILEYMALKKPTIATRGGGTNEIIEHLKTGILVPPGNPQIMSAKMKYLLDNPSKALTIGQAARNRIDQDFNLNKMVMAFYNLYQNLLAD